MNVAESMKKKHFERWLEENSFRSFQRRSENADPLGMYFREKHPGVLVTIDSEQLTIGEHVLKTPEWMRRVIQRVDNLKDFSHPRITGDQALEIVKTI